MRGDVRGRHIVIEVTPPGDEGGRTIYPQTSRRCMAISVIIWRRILGIIEARFILFIKSYDICRSARNGRNMLLDGVSDYDEANIDYRLSKCDRTLLHHVSCGII